MMTNLFSIFDPVTSISDWPLNWVSIVLGLVILPAWYWVFPSRYLVFFKMIEKIIKNEVIVILSMKKSMFSLLFVALFFMLFMNNLMGLVPYTFTATSHLVFTLALALPIWLGYFLYGMKNKTKHMLAHMVPQGTPSVLMSFMVLIETVSSLIRPFTLAVRLAANMVAGHLLLTLMSSAITVIFPAGLIGVVICQVALVVLEFAVAMIQAYVFMILSVLYTSEV